jgi:hypothetical protein
MGLAVCHLDFSQETSHVVRSSKAVQTFRINLAGLVALESETASIARNLNTKEKVIKLNMHIVSASQDLHGIDLVLFDL